MKNKFIICLVISALALSAAPLLANRQRFNTEPIDSMTVSIPLRDGTKTIFISPNSQTAVVYAYNGGAMTDSLRIKAGTGIVMYVAGLDSLRIERSLKTRISWVKNSSYENISAGYMNAFSKACPIAHGDTLAEGAETMSYSARVSNADALHGGWCHTFNTLHVVGYGNAAASLLLQVYHDNHLVAQFKVPSSVVFHSSDWAFDSLKVTALGSITYASYSVSWNNGEF